MKIEPKELYIAALFGALFGIGGYFLTRKALGKI